MLAPSRTTGGKSQCGREKAAGRQWTRGEGSEQPPRPAQERRVGRANHPGKSGRDVGARAAGGPRHRMHADGVLSGCGGWSGPGPGWGMGVGRRAAGSGMMAAPAPRAGTCSPAGHADRGDGPACALRGRQVADRRRARQGRPRARGTRRGGAAGGSRGKPAKNQCGNVECCGDDGRPLGRRWPAGDASLAT